MNSGDQLYRFLFKEHAIRGELVTLTTTLHGINNSKQWPPIIERLMAELVVSTSLLTASLKFAGDITLQLQGNGIVKFAAVNGNHRQQLRAVAKLQAAADESCSLRALLGDAVLAITVRPEEGDPYQGIAAMEEATIAQNLELWFTRSQQLPTRLILRHHAQGAAGILLQIMPTEEPNLAALDHLATLAETVTGDELCTTPAQTLLWRLYHQEQVILYPPAPVSFACSCSKARCNHLLAALTPTELINLLEQENVIAIQCEQCGQHYQYQREEVIALGLLT